MANTLAGRTWIVDTTGVLSLNPIKVKSILVGTTLTLKDNSTSANTVFTAAAAGYYPEISEWFLNGLQVTAVTGVAEIYLK